MLVDLACRPHSRARSRASSRRASWRRYSTRSRARAAHSASGSSSSGTPPVDRASTSAESRPEPGGASRAARSACSWASRSTARSILGPTQIWAGSALSIPAAVGPSSFSANRAIDWALYSERAAASGVSDGNSASRADSRLIRRPGLMSTSWHSRRALGRGHELVLRSPSLTVNRPRSWTLMANGLPSCWAHVAATLNIVSRRSRQVVGARPVAKRYLPHRASAAGLAGPGGRPTRRRSRYRRAPGRVCTRTARARGCRRRTRCPQRQE